MCISFQKTSNKCFSFIRHSHVYKHLNGSLSRKRKCLVDCFKILDSAKTIHRLKFKEAIYISHFKSDLSAQLQHNNVFCFFGLDYFKFQIVNVLQL